MRSEVKCPPSQGLITSSELFSRLSCQLVPGRSFCVGKESFAVKLAVRNYNLKFVIANSFRAIGLDSTVDSLTTHDDKF